METMQASSIKLGLCVPLLNAGSNAQALAEALRHQTRMPDRLLVIDSGCTDGSVAPFLEQGAEVLAVERERFDHGGVRRLAVEHLADCDVLLFMTQDALPANERSIELLVEALLASPKYGLAYGRQLRRFPSETLDARLRDFNYPPQDRVKSSADVQELGLRTAFASDVFAAYRREALLAVGNFPPRVLVNEDMLIAARMLLAGWKVVYCARAEVFHAHEHTLAQEWQRFFDIGVFHAREPWIREAFGRAEGEGWRFVRSRLLAEHKILSLLPMLGRCGVRWAAFRAGLLEKWLPLAFKRRLSAQKAFWIQETAERRRRRKDSFAGILQRMEAPQTTMVIDEDVRELFAEQGLDSFEAFMALEGEPVCHKRGRSVCRFRAGGRLFYLKKNFLDRTELLKGLWRLQFLRREADHEWRRIEQVGLSGIPVVTPVARGSQTWKNIEIASFLVTEALYGAIALDEILQDDFFRMEFGERNILSHKLAALIRRFHDQGFNHQDLYLNHIFMDSERRFYLLDLQRVELKSPLHDYRVIKDLAQLNYSAKSTWRLSSGRRLRFLLSYLGIGRLDQRARQMLLRIVAKTARIARHDVKLHKARKARGELP